MEDRGAGEAKLRGDEVRGAPTLGGALRRGEEIPEEVPIEALGMELPTLLETRGAEEGGAVYMRCKLLLPEPRAIPERPEPDDEGAGDIRLPTRGEEPDRVEGDFIEATSFAPFATPEEPEDRPVVKSEPERGRLRDGARGVEPREVVAVGVVDWEVTGEETAGGALCNTRPESPGLLTPMVPVPLRGPAPPPV